MPAPAPTPAEGTPQDETIVPDTLFEAAMPPIGDDIDAPLNPITPVPNAEALDKLAAGIEGKLEAIKPDEPEFAAALPPLSEFALAPPAEVTGVKDGKTVVLFYDWEVAGLEEIGAEARFRELSALRRGKGKAANSAMVSARASEDERLAVRLMQSLGYYDATVISTIEQRPQNSGKLVAVVTATPGPLYRIGTISVVADPTVPADLILSELPLKTGDPLEADRVQGAEANVSLRLPQRGYPFAQVGERDILLDEEAHTGDYTLPVDTGPRASFRGFQTEGRRPVFDTDHIAILARFRRDQLYDVRHVDDLREALIATSLFSTVSVEPVRTGEKGPDGTEYVDLLVRQTAGRPRTLAGELGYSTGQGIRLEGSWTHRNLFPPEGALIVSGVAGTSEQGASLTFRRSNWRQRDRTLTLALSANRSNFDAYESFTGAFSARISRDSTPIWQKRWTYYYGFEIVGSNEDRFNFNRNARDRGTYLIGALPGFVGYDTSDNLLNPTRGFRIKANVSPEASVRGAARPYARLMLEGTAYYPVTPSIVIAGRARVGSIPGIARDDLAPSRRYYAGGGGSVRGFGYQELGPRSPDGKPVGGRSLTEFAIEARYRFGNFGIVPFIDAGQVYEGLYPTGKNMRFGAGIGGRFYTNFGPLRVDVATPINRQPGESRISLYISIGQAF
ncbi:BamA/TamA family outer membrane protein [Sphingomonas sp. AOB5]|nr:BamA/TamA family outer membrane protein [Sphingomonas sp. AOB5]MDF7774529.1 BamA/TamA family outer membrane protein [Sphingomonas sp. AOB5]